MSQQNQLFLSDATVHVVAALHAVTNGIALTDDEKHEVDAVGVGLSPAFWAHACALFSEADQAGEGCEFDVGCEPQLLRWLGFPDERVFAGTFGCSVSSALDAGTGCLTELAYLVDTLDPRSYAPARYALARVWCRRARILADLRPRPLASIIEAIDRALSCPPESDAIRRSLLLCKAEAAHLAGDEALERSARGAMDEIERATGGRDLDPVVHTMTGQIVCICWLLAHGIGLLEAERELVDVQPCGESLWAEFRRALVERDWGRVPIPPAELFRNWYVQRVPTMPGALVDCLRTSAAAGLLETMVSAAEVLLGGGPPEDLTAPGPAYVVGALFERRVQLEASWTPIAGEPPSIWYEHHQGARRPETLERIELIRGLQPVMTRCRNATAFAPVSVYLDRAAEAEARGDFADERAALEVAVQLSEAVSDTSEQRHYAAVRLAVLNWREGNYFAAERLLAPLAGAQAAEARDWIATKKAERDALRQALEAFRSSTDLLHGSRLAWAHEDAGHSVRALEVGRALIERFPDQPAAEAVLGGLLFEQHRCRDAVDAFRSALARGFERILGEALLAQAACRIGDDGKADLHRLVRRSGERGAMVLARGRDVLLLESQPRAES